MSNVLMLVPHRSYHLYHKGTDMRKGFNQLCCIVPDVLWRTNILFAESFEIVNRNGIMY